METCPAIEARRQTKSARKLQSAVSVRKKGGRFRSPRRRHSLCGGSAGWFLPPWFSQKALWAQKQKDDQTGKDQQIRNRAGQKCIADRFDEPENDRPEDGSWNDSCATDHDHNKSLDRVDVPDT